MLCPIELRVLQCDFDCSDVESVDQWFSSAPGTADMGTQRFKLTLAYRGTRYHGWQSQPAMETWAGEKPPPGEGIPTIQGELAKALIALLPACLLLVRRRRSCRQM